MKYVPWFQGLALRQMNGIPAEALDEMVDALGRICEDPYDRLFSVAFRSDAPSNRMAEIGNHGFIEFIVDEPAGLIRVHTVVWVG